MTGEGGERRVLFVTHTSDVSGAEHALLELLRGLPARYSVRVLAPPGELADVLRRAGFAVGYVPGTTASLRFSPLRTLRGTLQLLSSAVRVRIAARSTNACLVHANSIRAGLIVVMASLMGGPPVVVHIHDVLPESTITRLVRRLLRARASALVGVSEYSRHKFLSPLAPSARPFPVLYNPIDVARFAPRGVSREEARRNLGISTQGPLLGIVAQITPWKGHDTAIAALALVRRSHPTTRLVCVGEAKFVGGRYDNAGFRVRLVQQIADLDLGEAVEFWGQRDDIPAILAAFDAILVPSWEEPLGRSVLEAMTAGTPVVATDVGGPPELIESGVTGYLVPPNKPDAWAESVMRLLEHPDEAADIAAAASVSAFKRCARERYVRDMLALYDDVLERG